MLKFKIGDILINNCTQRESEVIFISDRAYMLKGWCNDYAPRHSTVENDYSLKPVKVWTEDDIQPGCKVRSNRTGNTFNICECKGEMCVVWWVNHLGELNAYVEDKDFFVKRLNDKKFTKVS